jgi:glycosyltransferase involved in cell wall biosynthesis
MNTDEKPTAEQINRQPKVSIITVCYNSAETIRATIESVINQSYPNIEYIIIDGGSTDGTIDIIRDYEQNISKWVSEPDDGIYDAMNKGIKMAAGEIIGMINSDDWYTFDAVQVAVNSLTDEKTDIVHGDIIVCDRAGKQLYEFKGNEDLHQEIRKCMPIFHQTMFAKSEVYSREGLYNTRYTIVADYDFCFRVIYKYNIKHLNHIMTYVRQGGIFNTRYWLSAMEEYQIRKRNNINTYDNFLTTCRSAMGPFLRKIMEQHGAGKLIIWFRKKRRPNIQYFEDN